MIRELTYNNRILSEQERVEFCEKSDEYINMFPSALRKYANSQPRFRSLKIPIMIKLPIR